MPLTVTLNADDKEELFYFYYNWQAGQINMIHRGSCAKCKWGTGMRVEVKRGANGVWIGPFSSVDLAKNYVRKYHKIDADLHNCV
jgi:hypothetical protein